MLHYNFTPTKVLTWTTSPKEEKTGHQSADYYEIHIFPLQKLGQGRLNYILTKKMWINTSNLTSTQSFPLLGEVVLLKFISTLKEERSCNV